jgi:hypothetical protein
MYKKTILLLLVFVVCSCLLTSCRATRQEIQKTETQTQVTSEKLVTYKDTTVFAPKAETSLKISLAELAFKPYLNKDLKPKVYTQKNAQATVKIKVVHDTIQVTATCDSLAIVAKIKREFENQSKAIYNQDSNQKTKKSGFTLLNVLFATGLGFMIGYLLKFFKIL